MKSTNKLAFLSDLKLKKQKEIRKIEPLFKKQFQLSNRVSLSITPSYKVLDTQQESPTALNVHQLETEEEILFEIKQLSGERLSMLKDLFSYEEKYKNKLCLKARLCNLFQLCDNLQDLLDIASSQLVKESDLYSRLSNGLENIKLQEQRFKNKCQKLSTQRINSSAENSPVKQQEWLETQYCVNISGLTCLVYVKSNVKTGMFSMRFHLDSEVDVFEYELKKFTLSIQEAKFNHRFLKKAIEWEILPYFYFTAQSGELKLRFERKFEEKSMVLLANLKGIPYKYTAVTFQEQQDDFLLSITEHKIFPLTLSVLVSKSRLKLDSIKELIASNRRADILNLIHKNLCVFSHESTFTLEWETNFWNFVRIMHKQKLHHSPDAFWPVDDTRTSGLYSQYDLTLHQDVLIIDEKTLNITIQTNTILDTLRIIVQLPNSSHKFMEEDHRDEFLILRSLQSDGLMRSFITLMQSLELKCFINKMLNIR